MNIKNTILTFFNLNTSNKKLNSELKGEKDQLETILDYIHDGVIVTDKYGNILYLNKIAYGKLALTFHEIKGKAYSEVISMKDGKGNIISSENMPIHLALSLQKKIMATYRYVPGKDRNEFSASVISMPFENEKVIEIFHDLTREKEVYNLRSEFIAIASHELKTPLSAVKWYTELLLEDKNLTQEQKEFLGYVERSGDRMGEIITTFLDSSWMESNAKLNIEEINIKELIDEVLKELRYKVDNKKQILNIDLEEGIIVKADKRLLREVYLNLIGNSIKYTPNEGKIDVKIYKSNNELVSKIKDNGYGIPQEYQSKIFTKFFRANNILKYETEGTGLGLYLCKYIISKLNGKISFTSAENEGTEFAFSIPLS